MLERGRLDVAVAEPTRRRGRGVVQPSQRAALWRDEVLRAPGWLEVHSEPLQEGVGGALALDGRPRAVPGKHREPVRQLEEPAQAGVHVLG